MSVGLTFLIVSFMVLAFLAVALFFIIFGCVKKKKGFIVAGAGMIVLSVVGFAMLTLLNSVPR